MTRNSVSIYEHDCESFTQNPRLFFEIPAENLVRIINIDKISPEGGFNKALDFGCGEGRNTEYLLRKGYDVFGTDVSEGNMKTTKLRLSSYENYDGQLLGENEPLSCEDGSVGLVVAWEVMHWLGAKQSFLFYLDEFKRVTKKGGRIIITMPTDEHYLLKHSEKQEEDTYFCKAHDRQDTLIYSPGFDALKKIFQEQYGFEIRLIMRYEHGREYKDNPTSMTLDNRFSMYAFCLEVK